MDDKVIRWNPHYEQWEQWNGDAAVLRCMHCGMKFVGSPDLYDALCSELYGHMQSCSKNPLVMDLRASEEHIEKLCGQLARHTQVLTAYRSHVKTLRGHVDELGNKKLKNIFKNELVDFTLKLQKEGFDE